MKLCLVSAFILAMAVPTSVQAQAPTQTYTPIALAPGSYTQSVIVPQTATNNALPLCDATTATMEGGTNNQNVTWYEEGYDLAAPTTGLPHPGATFTGALNYYAPSAPVTWSIATISGASDVNTSGTLVSAIAWDTSTGSGATVNGVSFTYSGSASVANFVMTSGLNTLYESLAGSGAPFTSLPAAYQTILSGEVYGAVSSTCTLTNLIPGHSYLVQFWANDSRSCCDTRAETIAAGGVTSPTVPFNSTAAANGVGSVATGTFTANANAQSFLFTGNSQDVTQINAAQLRDTTVTALTNASFQYTMPSSYTVNNALLIDATTGFTTGTLTLATPTSLTNLSILTASGNSSNVISYSVAHSSGSPDTGTLVSPNWLAGYGGLMYEAQGYINSSNAAYSSVNAGVAGPCLYGSQIAVSGANPVTAITFTYSTGGGQTCIFALSGNDSGTNWSPLAVTGFDKDMVVEQGALQPGTFNSYTTATMDGGTANTSNTFYETGFNLISPNTGLPHAGATITSIKHPTRTYTMAPSYQALAADATLVSSAVPTATLVPASPAVYTAFSVLTGGDNIGAANSMSNTWIMQHADGTTESGVLVVYDWNSTSTTAATNKAYTAIGRFNVNSPGSFNDTLTNDAQLFEATYILTNTASPVTNMIVNYLSKPSGSNSMAYIFAISATDNGFPPVIATNPVAQKWYQGQTASFTVALSSGSAPLTNIWLVESNGVYYPLPNGLDGNGSTVYGATTTNLVISNLALADGTNYEVIITNAYYAATSTPALLTVSNISAATGLTIQSQVPPASIAAVNVFSNRTATFSVAVNTTASPPVSYQWYVVSPQGPTTNAIPNATATNYSYTSASSNATFLCIVSNLVNTVTSTPVSVIVTNPNSYQAAILSYNPVAYWPLTETSGTIAFDYAGGHDGIYMGSVGLGQSGIPFAGLGTNTSVSFDGSTAYVNTPTNTFNITGSISVIQWIQTTGESGNSDTGDGHFATTLGTSNSAYRLDVDGSGFPHFADESPDAIGATSVANGNWHQLVGVYSASTEYLYVDGTLAASAAATAPTGSTGDLWIGGALQYGTEASNPGSDRLFYGNIAQVAILTNALNSNQVAAIYNSLGIPPTVSITSSSPELYTNQTDTLTAVVATGTQPVGLQWFYIDNNMNSNAITGATNATYQIVDPPLSESGYTFGVIATNDYGTNEATTVLEVLTPSVYTLAILADKPISYWPLAEHPNVGVNNGTIAVDTVAGHNGYYSNSIIGVTPNDSSPPNYSFNINAPFGLADNEAYYAEFGQLTDPAVGAMADNYVANINGINFATPTNTATNISVEAWVYLNASSLTTGIVGLGYGGAEQFMVDTGGGGNAFRFYWRDASGNTHGNASPSGSPVLNTWYHVVGILSLTSNYVEIFTNGVLGQSNSLVFAQPPGIYAATTAVSIGSRQSGSGVDYNYQLDGAVADVAIYGYALSPAQVENHYLSSGVLPIFTLQPTNTSVGDGGRVTFYSTALGTLPMTYQWFDNTLNQAITGATSNNYTIPSASYNVLNGEQYYVVASNIYGATTSSIVTLTVIGGAPQVASDLQPSYTVSVGAPLTLSATFLGTTPLYYQWLYNGAPLAVSSRISSVTSNVLTIFPTYVADSGTYQLYVSNAFGTNYSYPAGVTVLPYLTFSTSGAGWSYNFNSASPIGGYIAPNVLELTDGNGSEATSSFSSNQVYIGNFAASFIYTVSAANNGADGMTFCLQNDPRGTAALGADGGSFGYSSGNASAYESSPAIYPSVALEFNLYNGATPFDDSPNYISLNTNGYLGDTGTGILDYTYPVLFNNGDPISVSLTYSNEIASLFMEDLSTTGTYSNSFPINIPAVLGSNLAYVGFTGGDGGVTSIQQVNDFTFSNFVSPSVIILSAGKSGANLVLSWPNVAGYQLQSIGNLAQSTNPAAWQFVPAPVIMTNGTSEVLIPFPAQPQFYRLELP